MPECFPERNDDRFCRVQPTRLHPLRRAALGLALCGAFVLVSACGSSDDSASTTTSAASEETTKPTEKPTTPDTDGTPNESDGPDAATVEDAISSATSCSIDDQFGRSVGGLGAAMVGLASSADDRPYDLLEGSFTCIVSGGPQNLGAALFEDASQATEVADWLAGAATCRPVSTVGPWVLFSAKALDQPQASAEFDAAVQQLGGKSVRNCT